MRTKFVVGVITAWWLAWPSPEWSAQAQLWKQFVPVSHTEAVPKRDLQLTQENGPWLIMAASFQGDSSEEQARALAEELRGEHLAAYIHDLTFDFSASNPGRGMDNYGAPARTRYQREKAHEFAVLVGDFESIDDPVAKQTLDRIKTMQPKSMKLDEEATSSLGQVRQFSANMLDKIGKQKQRGPMGKAFLARNPLLPREYFVPKGVDEFVAKMNKGVEHGLLECPGKYSVQVATFRGKTLLQSSTSPSKSEDSGWKWKKEKKNPLIEAAENAHLLTEELRAHGWEAYEFHDRTESIVTIGSFDQVAQQAAGGQIVATPQVQRIIQTFGAAYNTPEDPIAGTDADPGTERRMEEVKQKFNQMLTSPNAQLGQGMHPKHVKIIRGKKVERIVPLDISPHTMEVPRRSVSGAYAGG